MARVDAHEEPVIHNAWRPTAPDHRNVIRHVILTSQTRFQSGFSLLLRVGDWKSSRRLNMNVTRWAHRALALVVGLAGCSELPRPTQPEAPHSDELLASAPVGLFLGADPTSIPVGKPALIDFYSRTPALRRTITFAESPPDVPVDELVRAAREWIAQQRRLEKSDHRRSQIDSIEQLLDATTPDAIRSALGSSRARVAATRSIRPSGNGVFEHTAIFHIDGRDLLRVVTRAELGKRAWFECIDDPTLFYTDEQGCTAYDPGFDPEPVVADVAAMQYYVDAEAADLSALESRSTAGSRCEAERAALAAATFAFSWKAGETIWYAWQRNVLRTYTGLRDSSALLGTAIYTLRRYKECIAENG